MRKEWSQDKAPVGNVQVEPATVEAVQHGLVSWFQANRRDLPWRHTHDPYRILVSEIMLQQTQVDRVIPYYHAFLGKFPTVEALAAAPVADVINVWAGLGYNRRAVNLQRTAQHIVEHNDGSFPSEVEALRALPGIGPYTAGAIACFAFEQDVAFIDTNMRRVLHRLFAGVDVPKPSITDRHVLELATIALPAGQGWEWNQALMEFGALQCTARKPLCVICPLKSSCRAYPAIQTAIAELPRGVRLKPEAPFAGSNRYYRGRVLSALREASASEDENSDVDLRVLGPRIREGFTDADMPWLYGVVQGLQKDGLAMVAEESPTYDAGSQDQEDSENRVVRVRLP